MLGGMVPLAAAAEEAQTVMVSVKGTYIPPKMEAVLERINTIREKAMGDSYTPLKWSADLETAARLRAAEASVSFSHTRPNGQSWDTVFAEADAQNGKAENLAWNAGDETADAMQQAVELWYAEKAAYEKDKNDPSAGHYAALIDPAYKTIGIAAFQGRAASLRRRRRSFPPQRRRREKPLCRMRRTERRPSSRSRSRRKACRFRSLWTAPN